MTTLKVTQKPAGVVPVEGAMPAPAISSELAEGLTDVEPKLRDAVVAEFDAVRNYERALEMSTIEDETSREAVAIFVDAVSHIACQHLNDQERTLLAEVLKAHRRPSPYSEDLHLLFRVVSECHPLDKEGWPAAAFHRLLAKLYNEMEDRVKRQ